MSADILEFPRVPSYYPSDVGPGKGPTGPLMQQIETEETRLRKSMDNFPFGSQFDPSAGVSEDTLDEMPFAITMLREANDIIERAIKREAKYSLNNGWPAPADD